MTMTVLLAATFHSEPGIFVNLIKIGVVLLLLLLWALAVQWVDRDTDVVKTKREQWNGIVLSSGAVGFLAMLLPPWSGGFFALGATVFVLLSGGALLGYVVHRNGRVVPAARVCTTDHLRRIFSGGESRDKAVSEKGMRVRLADHAGKFVPLPSDRATLAEFETAQDVLYDLLWRRASDVDIVAGKEKYRLVYRVDGVASERQEGLAVEEGEQFIRYMKRLAGLNVEEIRRPQTGRIRASLLSHNGEVGYTEVSTSGTTAGERLRLKIHSGTALLRIHQLGLAVQRQEAVNGLIGHSKGLLLLSSLPHHGLTTTQYAILRAHDAYIQNIHTLERRTLLDLDNVTQRVYDGTNTDLNYARVLQSVLRREPDIVLVGECEDRETAQIATRAAAEDRKIYMGMTAKDSFEALSRYLGYVEDAKLCAKALIGIINQRLVRLLCTACREAFKPDAATLKKLNLPADKIERFYRPPTEQVLDKKGNPIICQACQGTGYVGRTGLFELLIVDEEISKLIAEGAAVDKIKVQCRKKRMHYLQEEGILKVIDGTTSLNEILRCLRSEGE